MKYSILSAGIFVALTSTTSAFASDFPQKFEHKFGNSVVDKKPIRVVSLSFNGPDNILALGVKPVAIRSWIIKDNYGVGPWGIELLGDAKPYVIEGELNIEKIAELQPDVILGMYSGINKEQYALLSEIAPTIAAEEQYTDYGTPWHIRSQTIARALGQSEKMEKLLNGVKNKITQIVDKHPDWKGKTATIGYNWGETPGVYQAKDSRATLVNQLGFVTPDAIAEAGDPDSFHVALSTEDISLLEADITIWMVGSDEDSLAKLDDLKLRKTLKVYKEGREILAPDNITRAMSYSTVLSIPYMIDELVPMIEDAIDGDPKTIVQIK
ncbi:MAG: hypothetical protein COB24_03120 [Hyphomicrobiales bacterium]|nr:MAG: hypothetical protein COB24_03120 [Hyphomicrobiales bacterium]